MPVRLRRQGTPSTVGGAQAGVDARGATEAPATALLGVGPRDVVSTGETPCSSAPRGPPGGPQGKEGWRDPLVRLAGSCPTAPALPRAGGKRSQRVTRCSKDDTV